MSIPLEQGLRHPEIHDTMLSVFPFYEHSIRTRIKTQDKNHPEMLSEFYEHSIRTRIKTKVL